MKKILVACGTGMSTSTMIAHKLQEFLTEQGISATTAQCCLNEIPLNCNGMDLIGKRKLTAVCSHQTRIGNLDAHLI